MNVSRRVAASQMVSVVIFIMLCLNLPHLGFSHWLHFKSNWHTSYSKRYDGTL